MLEKWEIEKEVDHGRRRIDLFAKNHDESGFFYRAREHFHIPCPYVFIECKNYKQDPGNPELDQLAGRLKDSHGLLGLLICRAVMEKEEMLARTKFYLPDKKILVLTDVDLRTLCECTQNRDEKGITDLLESKLDDLLLH